MRTYVNKKLRWYETSTTNDHVSCALEGTHAIGRESVPERNAGDTRGGDTKVDSGETRRVDDTVNLGRDSAAEHCR